mgnify:CR=1 FL=1
MAQRGVLMNQPADGILGRVSDLFFRKPGLLLLILLGPPLIWIGVVYVGSLVALLVQSFYSIDEFSGRSLR